MNSNWSMTNTPQFIQWDTTAMMSNYEANCKSRTGWTQWPNTQHIMASFRYYAVREYQISLEAEISNANGEFIAAIKYSSTWRPHYLILPMWFVERVVTYFYHNFGHNLLYLTLWCTLIVHVPSSLPDTFSKQKLRRSTTVLLASKPRWGTSDEDKECRCVR